MVIHDFPADQAQMVTEAIVNMIINTQVQTLLKVFQYKSVSSLYKMLREKITSSLQSYDMHFELCKREIITRLQDPLLTMKFRDMTQRLTGEKCTAQEYVSTDCMLSGELRLFWIIPNECNKILNMFLAKGNWNSRCVELLFINNLVNNLCKNYFLIKVCFPQTSIFFTFVLTAKWSRAQTSPSDSVLITLKGLGVFFSWSLLTFMSHRGSIWISYKRILEFLGK